MNFFHSAVLIIFFASSVLKASQDELPRCESRESSPRLRIELSNEGFKKRLETSLRSQRYTIEDAVNNLNFDGEYLIANKNENCSPEAAEPGFNAKSKCLYLPKALFGGDIELRNFTASFKKSRAARLLFRDIKINQFSLGDLQTSCKFDREPRVCAVRSIIHKFEITSHIDLVDPVDNKTVLLTTLTPLNLVIESKKGRMPVIELSAILEGTGAPSEVVKIVRDSMKFNIPPETLTFNAEQRTEDFIKVAYPAMQPLFPKELSEKERLSRFAEYLEKYSEHPLIAPYVRSFVYLTMGGRFVSYDEVAKAWIGELITRIRPPLSELISGAIQKAIPFDNTVQFALPLRTGQEIFDGPSILVLMQDMAAFLQSEIEGIQKTEGKNQIHRRVKKNSKFYERTLSRLENLKKVRIEGMPEISAAINIKARTLVDIISNIDKPDAKIIKILREIAATSAVLSSERRLLESRLPEVAGFQVTEVVGSSSGAVAMAVSTCHIGGEMTKKDPTDSLKNWDRKQTPQVLTDKSEFYAEIPVDLINQYLVILHRAGYFDYCEGKKGAVCSADPKSKLKIEYKFTKPPQVKLDKDGQYYLIADNIDRTSRTPLGKTVSRALFSESTDLKMCLNFVQNAAGELVPKDCVHMKANIGDNLRVQNAIALVNFGTAIAMVGLKIFRTLGQNWILSSLDKDDFVEGTLNKYFKDESDLNIKYLQISDGVIKISGDFRK